MDGTTSEEEESVQLNGANDGRKAVILPRSSRKHSRQLPQIEMSEYNWKKTEVSPTGSIRRKFVFTVPGVMKQHQPREYKLKAFVVFLFFLITIYVALTYVFHKQQELHLVQVEIAEGIRFEEKSRQLRVLNYQKNDVLFGRLGRNLHSSLLPYDCLFPGSHDSRCFKWKETARLHIIHRKGTSIGATSDSIRCYSIKWETLSTTHQPLDCYSMENAAWFGFGEVHNSPWPMDIGKTELSPYLTGNGPYGSILQKYWLSSKAVAIFFDEITPLVVSTGEDLCFGSLMNSDGSNSSLNYRICVGKHITAVHSFIAESMQPKPIITSSAAGLLDAIVWTTDIIEAKVDRSNLFGFIDTIVGFGQDSPGQNVIVITRNWQKEDGDFVFDENRFPNVQEMVTTIHNKGFKIAVTVHPYISTSSINYIKGIDEELWVKDESNTVPALTKWRDMPSAAILDFTSSKAVNWFLEKLNKTLEIGIDGFVYEGGDSIHIPRSVSTKKPFKDRDTYLRAYTSVAVNSGSTLSVSSSAGMHKHQAFVTISPRTSDWSNESGLRSIIPTVLSVGLSGYPFVNPGTVGGEGRPDKELFIRWMQLSTFLPVVQISGLPEDYDKDIVENLLKLRRDVVLPALKRALAIASKNRLPIVRPVWWLGVNDTDALGIDDQFLIGDHLLVAPILRPSLDHRNVYLPVGYWNDPVSNRNITGPLWLQTVEAPLHQILYFVRLTG